MSDKSTVEMRPLGSERWPDGLIAAAAAFALAGALLNNFLRFNGYPFFQPEVGLVAIIALMGAVLFGLVYHLLGRRAVIPRSLLEGLLIAFAVSMQIDGPWLLLALGLATAIFVWKFKRSTLPFVGLASAVTIAVSTAGIGQQTQDFIDGPGLRSAAQGTPGPTLVHIILDEHVGVKGMPDGKTARHVRDLYLSKGFRVFGGAYSRHVSTSNSASEILNFGQSVPTPPNGSAGFTLRANAYFGRLRDMGLRIHVLQSDYLDYCSGEEVATCTTYNAQHFANLEGVELSTSGKAFLIVRDLLPERLKMVASWFYRRLAQQGVRLPIPDPSGIWGDMNAINSVIAARMIAHDLSTARPGNAYFIHILLPHFPFVTDSRCRILPVDMWRDRTNEAIPIERLRAAYADQVRCTTLLVADIYDSVLQSPARSNFIMIVHGDHGSRLRPLESASPSQTQDDIVVENYSTLFAVRAPGLSPAYEDRHVPVSLLLRDLSMSGFRQIEAKNKDRAMVLAPAPNGGPHSFVKLQLPKHW